MLNDEQIEQICRKYTLLCPICEQENTHSRLKRDMVRPIVTEGDGHPIENKWAIPGFDQVNPLEFFWGFCRKCFYTGELESAEFRQAERNLTLFRNQFRSDAIQNLKSFASIPGAVTHSLSLRLDDEDPVVSLISKFYLGIFSHLQLQKYVPGNIARYYLRIGWVFRDIKRYYPDSSIKRISGNFKKIIRRFELEIPQDNDYPIKPALVLSEEEALRYAQCFFERNFEMLKEANLEDELKLTNLIAEISFRIYELSSAPEDYKVSSSFYSAVIQKCLGIISDKSVAGGSVNRARQLLDVAGDRGRELRQLNKQIESGGNGRPKPTIEKVSPALKKKQKGDLQTKSQSDKSIKKSNVTSKSETTTNQMALGENATDRAIEPELTLDEAKNKLAAFEKKVIELNSHLKELEDSLKRWRNVAGRDHLTSLPNKNSLLRLTIPKALKSLTTGGVFTCYGFLFQQIAPMNVRNGWSAGDQALLSTANYLKKLLNEGEELFRLDGAIFAVWSSASLNVARPRSAELRRIFSNGSVKVGKGEMSLQASIGIVTVEKVTTDTVDGAAEKVFGALMSSIFRARDEGGNTVHIHSSQNF